MTRTLIAFALAAAAFAARPPQADPMPGGELIVNDPYSRSTGERCPLKHTAVRAEISGYVARVLVTQHFENTTGNKIEAVYTFPLPDRAAVDSMTMTIGDRTIKAEIRTREDARRLYDEARNRGNTAALLDQHRPNVFRQSVANIEPGAKIQIALTYVEVLPYEAGTYEWSFPTVVGPRYVPKHTPEAAEVNPKYAPPATRAGHDISLEVSLDAGLQIRDLRSTTHEIDTQRPEPSRASVRLRQKAVLPNKDFTLRYTVAGERVADAFLTHRSAQHGYFTFVLQPPSTVPVEDVTPKELVFVLDTSGSMSGFPIEKAKEAMKYALDGLYPRDTFNLITFAGDTHVLFPQPVPATRENLATAQAFLSGRRGGGGTEMMKAIRAALAPSSDRDNIRIVCFMTDGYVGNDFEIIGEIKRNPNARVFTFGIGSSVNRFLLDRMAREGRGEAEFVNLSDDGSAAARRFHERIRTPLLTDVSIEWNGLPVMDVYPTKLPDLFAAKPVVVHGRYVQPGAGEITLRGNMAGRPFARKIRVNLPSRDTENYAISSVWAREKIEHLMAQDWQGFQQNNVRPEIREQITRVGLDHRLVTQFTSFVAIDNSRTTAGGEAQTVEVPVEMPDGVSHEGVFGSRDTAAVASMPMRFKQAVAVNESFVPKALPSVLVLVEIWLSDATPETLERLKALGFKETVPARVAKIRRGTIRAEKLEELSKLKAVLSVKRVTE